MTMQDKDLLTQLECDNIITKYQHKREKLLYYYSIGYYKLCDDIPPDNIDLDLVVSVSSTELIEEIGQYTVIGFVHSTKGVVILWRYHE